MFESLASCSAAYKPSFGWGKSRRLRGSAFRCSASFNMTGCANAVEKRQSTAALQNVAAGKNQITRLRFGVRRPSGAFDCPGNLKPAACDVTPTSKMDTREASSSCRSNFRMKRRL